VIPTSIFGTSNSYFLLYSNRFFYELDQAAFARYQALFIGFALSARCGWRRFPSGGFCHIPSCFLSLDESRKVLGHSRQQSPALQVSLLYFLDFTAAVLLLWVLSRFLVSVGRSRT